MCVRVCAHVQMQACSDRCVHVYEHALSVFVDKHTQVYV